MDSVKSESDDRVVNNASTGDAMRHNYRVLSEEEKMKMASVKSCGQELLDLIKECGSSRELSIAATKTEEAVMWAVKHITK